MADYIELHIDPYSDVEALYKDVLKPEWSHVEHVEKGSCRPGDAGYQSLDLSFLKDRPYLKSVNLSFDCGVFNLNEFSRGSFPNLRSLVLGNIEEAVDWNAMGKCAPNVETLSLQLPNNTSADFLPEEWRSKVTRLTLSHFNFGPDTSKFSTLEGLGCSKLVFLDVSGTGISSFEGVLPPGTDSLPIRELRASNCECLVSLKGVEHMQLLESISLSNTGICADALAALKDCPTLTSFDAMSCCQLKSIEQLGARVLRQLKSVSVAGSAIEDWDSFASSLNPDVIERLYGGSDWEEFYSQHGHAQFPKACINNYPPGTR